MIISLNHFADQVMFHAEEIKQTGEFKTSAGNGVWTSVAVHDIAAAAAVVLSDPSKHAGHIYTLTTDAVTDGMVAEMISKVIGRKVIFSTLPQLVFFLA